MSMPNDDHGSRPIDSLREGFICAWATAVGSCVLAVALGWVLNRNLQSSGVYGDRGLLAGMLPPLCLLGLLGWSYFSNRRQLAMGILAAFGTMFALMLLLIASCFGLFGFNAF